MICSTTCHGTIEHWGLYKICVRINIKIILNAVVEGNSDIQLGMLYFANG